VAGRGAARLGGPSVDGPCWHHPLAGLARDPGDQIEICVVVKDGKAAFLCRRGDQQVRDLPPLKAAGGKQSLHLAGPPYVHGIGLDQGEGGQRRCQAGPLAEVAG